MPSEFIKQLRGWYHKFDRFPARQRRKRRYLDFYLRHGFQRKAEEATLKMLDEALSRRWVDTDDCKAIANTLSRWYSLELSRHRSTESAQKCLQHVEFFAGEFSGLPAIQKRELAVWQAECLQILDQTDSAQALLVESLDTIPDQNLYFALANVAKTEQESMGWVNQGFAHMSLEPLTLEAEEAGRPAIDRLRNPATAVARDNSAPLVSVIMPAYNSAKTLSTAVDSILTQTWSALELIVVDDCSTDDTAQLIRNYAAKDNRVIYLQSETNAGAYCARNEGLARCRGEFVTTHDADDWSHPQKLQIQVEHLLGNPDVIANTSQRVRVRNDFSFYRRSQRGELVFKNYSSLMFRKEPALARAGYWDTVRFAADTDYIHRLERLFGKNKVVHMPSGVLAFQRQTDESLTGSSAFGFHGVLYGARREYRESCYSFYQKATDEDLKFPLSRSFRPFPVPNPMRTDRMQPGKVARPVDVVIAADFRVADRANSNNAAIIAHCKTQGKRVGLMQLDTYNFNVGFDFHSSIRALVNGETVEVLVYGELIETAVVIVPAAHTLEQKLEVVPHVICSHVIAASGMQGNSAPLDLESHGEYLKYYFDAPVTWVPRSDLIASI